MKRNWQSRYGLRRHRMKQIARLVTGAGLCWIPKIVITHQTQETGVRFARVTVRDADSLIIQMDEALKLKIVMPQ